MTPPRPTSLAPSEPPHLVGTILKFNALDRNGTIAPADGSEEIFFHSSNVFSGQGEIRAGAEVTFNVKANRYVRWAEHIKIVAAKSSVFKLEHFKD